MCKGYNWDNGNFIFNYHGATSKIKDYVFGDGSEGVLRRLSELATKEDLTALASGTRIGNISFYSSSNNSENTVAKKLAPKNSSHFTGLLIIDQNRVADIYSVGLDSKVKTILKTSSFADPSFSADVLSVTLSKWGTVAFIGIGEITIS